MVQNIFLEPEQEELLVKLVEAWRNVTHEERRKFMYADSFEGTILLHPGLPSGNMMVSFSGDIEILGKYGLLSISRHPERKDIRGFHIMPAGFRYYEHLKTKLGQPVERVQSTIREYLSSSSFERTFPGAYQKWTEAETLLWSADSERQLSMIGHLCREAMQEFASGLITLYKLPNIDPNIQNTVARIRAVLNHRVASLGKNEKAFLDALLPYWGTVVDLVQRQEHAGQKEGEPIVWEDSRRVVFQTAVVMFEIASALERGSNQG